MIKRNTPPARNQGAHKTGETALVQLEDIILHLAKRKQLPSGEYPVSCPCPEHGKGRGDINPSLSIRITPDGKFLVHCFAGCSQEAVLRELRRRAGLDAPRRDDGGLTLQQYADAKRLPIDLLRQWYVSDAVYEGKPALKLEYRDESGNLITTQYRLALTGERFRWKKGDGPRLYGLWKLPRWNRKALWVVEGSSDAHTLWSAGMQAIAFPSASAKELISDFWSIAARFESVHLCLDADGAGAALLQAVLNACPDALRERACAVQLPDGVKDVSALWLQVGGDAEAFRNALAQCKQTPLPSIDLRQLTAQATAESDAKQEREPQGMRLAKAALERITELFTAQQDGALYLTLKVNGHVETHPLKSRAVENYLAALCNERGYVPRDSTINEALAVLRGEAAKRGDTREVHIRVGGDPAQAIYLDLCTPDWRIVEVTPAGWRVIPYSECLIRFIRPRHAQPLPIPTRGRISDLRRFLRVSDADFLLILGWLLMALRPDAPYPILALRGEQGSGKSTATRLLREIIDPRTTPHAAAPHKLDDLMVQAAQAHIVAYDNLSRIPEWLSNAFCRLSTGAGLEKRELYSDAEVVTLHARRPLIINAIREIIERPDLADRTLQVELLSIPEQERMPERDLLAAWQGAWAGLLGALLDGVSYAMRTFQSLRLPTLPRMADFAVWSAAGVQAYGYTAEQFLNAYDSNRAALAQQLTERDQLATAIVELMAKREAWEGTASELLQALQESAGEGAHLPKPNKLKNRLLEITPLLRSHGIRYIYRREERARTHRLEKFPAVPSVSSVSSATPQIELNSADDCLTIQADDTAVSSGSIVRRFGASVNSTADAPDDTDDTDDTAGSFIKTSPTDETPEDSPAQFQAPSKSPPLDDSSDGEILEGDALVEAILEHLGGRDLIGREKVEHRIQLLLHDPLESPSAEEVRLAREVWQLAEQLRFPALVIPGVGAILAGEKAWGDALYPLIGDARLELVYQQLQARARRRNGSARARSQPALFLTETHSGGELA